MPKMYVFFKISTLHFNPQVTSFLIFFNLPSQTNPAYFLVWPRTYLSSFILVEHIKVILESLYRCVNAVFNAGKSSSSLLS